jgi:hypothetical protein
LEENSDIDVHFKINRCRYWGRKSKRIISWNDHRRRQRNIEMESRNMRGNSLVRDSMLLRAVQSPVHSFKLLRCDLCMLQGI